MRTLIAIAFLLTAFHVGAEPRFHDSVPPPPVRPAPYSFADLYHLTVSGAALDGAPLAAPVYPALYSFADLYRLTVDGAELDGAPLAAPAETPARLTAQPSPEQASGFPIVRMPEPPGWLQLLSGLTLALWVARRRLGASFR